MWRKKGGRPLRFTATQRIAVERVEFSWRARFPILGPLALDVIDEYVDGDGRLPTHAEVYWDLPSGRFTYWDGRITSFLTSDRPFGEGVR